MSLEERLDANTASMDRLTAALQGKAAAVSTPAAKPTPPKPAVSKPKKSVEEVMTAAVAVKSAISKEAAAFLIAKHGGAEGLKSLKPAVYDAFCAECESAVEAGAVEGMDAPGDGDDL